jgi:ATP-dependent Clp protease ATP-binding subunit ClpC
MFERYTEKARRVIFFARYEASTYGSPYIEVAHFLLGLLREDFPTIRLVANGEEIRVRRAIEALCRDTGQKIATSVDIPLSHSCRRVLLYGEEEADRLGHELIGPQHLLMGSAADARSGSRSPGKRRDRVDAPSVQLPAG